MITYLTPDSFTLTQSIGFLSSEFHFDTSIPFTTQAYSLTGGSVVGSVVVFVDGFVVTGSFFVVGGSVSGSVSSS